MLVLRVFGVLVAAALIAVAGFVADVAWNDGRLFYFAMGKDTLVGLCTPPARDALAGRGFAPTDFAIDDHPSIAFESGSFGRNRVLSAPFTFSDGPDGQRVDGHLVCAVHGKTVQVKVDVEATPLRAA